VQRLHVVHFIVRDQKEEGNDRSDQGGGVTHQLHTEVEIDPFFLCASGPATPATTAAI